MVLGGDCLTGRAAAGCAESGDSSRELLALVLAGSLTFRPLALGTDDCRLLPMKLFVVIVGDATFTAVAERS